MTHTSLIIEESLLWVIEVGSLFLFQTDMGYILNYTMTRTCIIYMYVMFNPIIYPTKDLLPYSYYSITILYIFRVLFDLL